ncbi:conserved hypothetical protein [uncultured delta proteobacterium]|uniref:Uncharacterized protein n=1 Tax=uncultured delta proteobacterium TaxID=34034 RepID=A0A212J2V6_9DELT|nr:conserved hypothetical protein [uncultured delta proteobacterium]
MSFHKVEVFGHVVYSPDLSYDDLLAREEGIKAMVQTVLEKAGGDFIHFEALGDALRFQCVLTEEREEAFHAICDNLAPAVKNGLDARLLMVDKDLDTLYFYSVTGGKWQEALVGLPPAGYTAPPQAVKLEKPPTDHARSKKK